MAARHWRGAGRHACQWPLAAPSWRSAPVFARAHHSVPRPRRLRHRSASKKDTAPGAPSQTPSANEYGRALQLLRSARARWKPADQRRVRRLGVTL